MVTGEQESMDTLERFISYAEFGGGILLQGNSITEVVGCPSTVDTSVFNIAVAIYDPLLQSSTDGFRRTIIYPNNQYFYDSI
jgi:hypothetical protein